MALREDDPPTQKFHKHQISLAFIIMLCLLGIAVLFVVYLLLFMKYYTESINSRRRSAQVFEEEEEEESGEEFFYENQGPVLDHPIWYINTIGLQQSIIDSITVCQYKRDDGLVEGKECSVCLSEFQEDESLRLLPKCSHAFHIPCIDTWLRSHKNCPLCRAPIVSDTNDAHMSIGDSNLSDLGSREEEGRVENFDNFGGLGSHAAEEDGTSEIRVPLPNERGLNVETSERDLSNLDAKNCGVRVLCDLADHRPNVEEELQPVRRSVSMDSLSVARVHRAVTSILPPEHEGSSRAMSVQVKKTNLEVAAKRLKKSWSKHRLNSSFDPSVQKGHVSVKRSFSSSGMFSLPRRSRSQDSTLPL